MMTRQELALSSPPDYEYETEGPWFVCHVDDEDRTRAWIMQVFSSAVLRFWLAEKTPKRRVMVDSRGVTVLGTASFSAEKASMCGTRQTCDETLSLVKMGSRAVEDHAVVLTMIEGVRAMDGQAL